MSYEDSYNKSCYSDVISGISGCRNKCGSLKLTDCSDVVVFVIVVDVVVGGDHFHLIYKKLTIELNVMVIVIKLKPAIDGYLLIKKCCVV